MLRKIICLVAICSVTYLAFTTSDAQARHRRGDCRYNNRNSYDECNYGGGHCSHSWNQSNYGNYGYGNNHHMNYNNCGCNNQWSNNNTYSSSGSCCNGSNYNNVYQQANYVQGFSYSNSQPACCGTQNSSATNSGSTTYVAPAKAQEVAVAPNPGM